MKFRTLTLTLSALAMMAFAAPATAGDKVPIDEVPEKVRATIEEHVKDGKLGTIERDQDEGEPVTYEVEYTATDGKEYELHIAEDGKLLSKEED